MFCYPSDVMLTFFSTFLTIGPDCQTALKGEEDTTISKKDNPGKKRKNHKKNRSRKRSSAPSDKEVGTAQ